MTTQFFETRMGQRYYNASIPKLIDALEVIGKELKRANNKKEKEEEINDKTSE